MEVFPNAIVLNTKSRLEHVLQWEACLREQQTYGKAA